MFVPVFMMYLMSMLGFSYGGCTPAADDRYGLGYMCETGPTRTSQRTPARGR